MVFWEDAVTLHMLRNVLSVDYLHRLACHAGGANGSIIPGYIFCALVSMT